MVVRFIVYLCVLLSVCVCVCVCVREREREQVCVVGACGEGVTVAEPYCCCRGLKVQPRNNKIKYFWRGDILITGLAQCG